MKIYDRKYYICKAFTKFQIRFKAALIKIETIIPVIAADQAEVSKPCYKFLLIYNVD